MSATLPEIDQENLENYIDKHGLERTVAKLGSVLADICFEKADHIEENWQDADLAKEWRAKGKQIEKDFTVKSTKINQ